MMPFVFTPSPYLSLLAFDLRLSSFSLVFGVFHGVALVPAVVAVCLLHHSFHGSWIPGVRVAPWPLSGGYAGCR